MGELRGIRRSFIVDKFSSSLYERMQRIEFSRCCVALSPVIFSIKLRWKKTEIGQTCERLNVVNILPKPVLLFLAVFSSINWWNFGTSLWRMMDTEYTVSARAKMTPYTLSFWSVSTSIYSPCLISCFTSRYRLATILVYIHHSSAKRYSKPYLVTRQRVAEENKKALFK